MQNGSYSNKQTKKEWTSNIAEEHSHRIEYYSICSHTEIILLCTCFVFGSLLAINILITLHAVYSLIEHSKCHIDMCGAKQISTILVTAGAHIKSLYCVKENHLCIGRSKKENIFQSVRND